MSRRLVLSFVDGREVEALSATDFFEKLRRSERVPPPDLGRYLDLIRSRGLLGYGLALDVGTSGADIEGRCGLALRSLVRQGWVRRVNRSDAARSAADLG